MSRAPAGSSARRAPRRAYDSPLRARRAGETKASLIDTATALFTAKGWAATGMREVAREAGVAVETLYSHFPSKRALLDAVIDQVVAGDDEPIPVAERPGFLALGHGSRPDRITAAASLLTEIHARTAVFARLVREAAASDEEIADVLRLTRDRQRTDVAAGLALILGRSATDLERDGVWAIASPETFLLLSDGADWPPERYRRWLADTLDRLLADH